MTMSKELKNRIKNFSNLKNKKMKYKLLLQD